jgi:hypothetical protein
MKIICDRCNNYEVSASGTTEICHAKRDNSKHIQEISDHYINLRQIGEKTHCKKFRKL